MGKVLVARIKEGSRNVHGSYLYKNEINLEDFKRVALFFFDLETQGNVSIEKAFREFQRLKEEQFPF